MPITIPVIAADGATSTIQVADPVVNPATGGLPIARMTTWVPGMMAVGGVPNRTTIYTTINASTYGNGATDAAAGIQAAINSCPLGQVVLLSSGTFLCNGYLLINRGITLRGSGAGKTIIKKTNGAVLNSYSVADAQPNIIVGPSRWPWQSAPVTTNLTVDGAKGSKSVTVSSASNFRAGQIVGIDELSGASWQPDRLGMGQVWASPDYRVVWQLHNPHQGIDDPLTATTPTGGDAASWFCRRDRPTGEMKEIASIAGNVITFTTPLHIDYRVSHTAQIVAPTGADAHVKNIGIENLTTIGGSDASIRFMNAAYCWAKGVEVTVWLGEGIAVNSCFRVEVRDSYLHDAAWAQPGGAGYAISLSGSTADVLFENNISMMANKVMVARCAGAGSVFGYNYVDDGYINTNGSWIEVGLNASHMVGPHHVLFEGNYGFNFDSDHTHGNSIYHTVFRNHLRGVRKPFVDPLDSKTYNDAAGAGPKRCIGLMTYSYWMNFIGNVLGIPGQMSGYTYNVTGTVGMNRPGVWLLGWSGFNPYAYDANCESTSVRDGNYDYLTNSVNWHNTPGGYPLPNSLYLTSKPAFFGSATWPWVNPTGTPQILTLPAQARYAAGTPLAGS